METYAIKVDTQNLSKSFYFFEDEKLNYTQALHELKKHQNKYNNMIKNKIEPVIFDDRNRAVKVRKMYIVSRTHKH